VYKVLGIGILQGVWGGGVLLIFNYMRRPPESCAFSAVYLTVWKIAF